MNFFTVREHRQKEMDGNIDRDRERGYREREIDSKSQRKRESKAGTVKCY